MCIFISHRVVKNLLNRTQQAQIINKVINFTKLGLRTSVHQLMLWNKEKHNIQKRKYIWSTENHQGIIIWLNRFNTNMTTQQKHGSEIWIHISQKKGKKTWMTNKYMNTCVDSLVIMEMQVKSQWDIIFHGFEILRRGCGMMWVLKYPLCEKVWERFGWLLHLFQETRPKM